MKKQTARFFCWREFLLKKCCHRWHSSRWWGEIVGIFHLRKIIIFNSFYPVIRCSVAREGVDDIVSRLTFAFGGTFEKNSIFSWKFVYEIRIIEPEKTSVGRAIRWQALGKRERYFQEFKVAACNLFDIYDKFFQLKVDTYNVSNDMFHPDSLPPAPPPNQISSCWWTNFALLKDRNFIMISRTPYFQKIKLGVKSVQEFCSI